MRNLPVCLSGGSGFLGRALTAELLARGAQVTVLSSSPDFLPQQPAVKIPVSDFASDDLTDKLVGQHVLIHCAARAHIKDVDANDPLVAYRHVNTTGTVNLARQAAAAGVRRFIFISSIGVHGAETFGQPFSHNSDPAPHSPYALSKYEAETALRLLGGPMEVVIIRPPLIYGPQAPGNFALLMRALSSGWPLPLGAVRGNRRSLIYIENLVDLLCVCLEHPTAAGQVWLASDGEDISTTDLLTTLADHLGRSARLLPVPAPWLRWAGKVLGKEADIQRLYSSLQVDIRQTKERLSWTPPFRLDQGLQRTAAAWYTNETPQKFQ